MFEGLTIVIRAFMVAGIPVMLLILGQHLRGLWEIWKGENKAWKR